MTPITTAQAATLANVTVATVRAWCRIGAVSAVKVSGKWEIDRASLTARIDIALDIETARITRNAKAIAALADLTPYRGADEKKTAQAKKRAAEKVLLLLEDGAIIPTSRVGLYSAVSSDGQGRYLVDTHTDTRSCECASWVSRTYCTHMTAAEAIEASKTNRRPALPIAA